MDDWNAVGAALQYQSGNIAAQPCNGSDHINSAGWSFVTCNNQQFGDAIALTRRNYEQIGGTWYLSDADIVFDQSLTWNPHYAGPLRRDAQDFRRVILHELGHAFGLDHPDDAGQTVTAIMNSHTSDIDSLQQDDKNGILALYPISTTSANDSTDQTAQTGGDGGGGGNDPAMTLLAFVALLIRRGVKTRSWSGKA